MENERQARRDADAHSRRADTNAAKAHEAVERLLKRVAQKRLANEPRMEHLRRELMEDALEFYLGFLEKKRDDPSARHDVADAYGRVAVISAGLGRHEQAADALDKALAVLKPVLDLEPKNPRYRLCLAKLLGNRGALYDGQGRHDEAERYLRQALDVAERLAAEHPQEPDYTVQRARTLGNLGVSCSRPGRVKEAEGFHRAALQLREELAKRFPQNAQYRQDVAMNQTNLGHTLEGLGRDLEALSAYETAIGIQTRLVEERPNDPEIREELAGSYNNRGNVLKRAGRLQEAEDSFRQSAALWGRLIAEYPVPSYARFCVAAHHSVGTTLAQMGQFRKAEEAYRRALAVQERLAAAFPNEVELHRELAGHRADLAWFLCTWPDPEVRKPADALRLAQQAVNHAPDDRRYWRSLGIAQYRAAQWQDAIQSLIKCIELRQNSYTSTECFFLAMAHHQLGDQDEARQWFERGVIWLAKYKAAAPMTQQLLRIEAAELLGIQETDRLDNNPENSPKK